MSFCGYTLSQVEERGIILSHVQTDEALADLMPPKLELSTENIFAPKTKDMDTGYFVPAELKNSLTCKHPACLFSKHLIYWYR